MIVEIGGTQISIETRDPVFHDMLRARYANFDAPVARNPVRLEVEIVPGDAGRKPGGGAEAPAPQDEELAVNYSNGVWDIRRGDFLATWDPLRRHGSVRQTANPWSIDTLIRIVHSLELASTGGFLLHAASAIRNGKAYIFTGPSGAGKTTISRLAPASAALLTDEISYIRAEAGSFRAWGTPFAGELGTPGPNVSAPVAALYFLEHGPQNRTDRLAPADALRSLMKNILFFADDSRLVEGIFETAHRFLENTEAFRLAFVPDAAVWSHIP
jgi:hypothetical protein